MELIAYISLTCLGIIGKLWAFTVIKRTWQQSIIHRCIVAFVICLLSQSTFELLLYILPAGTLKGQIALNGYYLSSLAAISILPFIVLLLTRKVINHAVAILIISFIALIGSVLISSNLIISGTSHTGVSLTRIAGEYYWLFQVTTLSCVIYTFYLLIITRNHSDGFLKIRTNNLLIAFSIGALYIISIVVAMQFIEGINAVGLLPLVVALFVIGLTDNVCNESIQDYRYWIPFSAKRRQINHLIKPFITIQSDGLDEDIKKRYNQLLAEHALSLFDNNQTRAAEWLKVSQSWISRHKPTSK